MRTIQEPGVCSRSRGGFRGLTEVQFLWGAAFLLLLVLLPACSVLRAPQKVVNAVVPGTRTQPDLVELQLEVQRFVDDFSTRTAQVLDDYARTEGTESARVRALQLKLMSVAGAINVASGPNPSFSLLDLVSTISIRRRVIEDHWMKTTNGAAFGPWLELSRSQETNVWQLAARYLKPAQMEELRNYIQQWYVANREYASASFVRPEGLSSILKTTRQERANPDSVFNLVGLDPTAGLDPAVREVTRTRLFAERALFTFQHTPFLLRWQTELLSYQLAAQPAAQLVLTNSTQISESVSRISRATESFSQTASQLPDRIAAERQAILSALDQQEGKLRALAAEVNRTLISGEGMSTSLNTTITTFDKLMKRFGVGEPSTVTNPVPDTNSPPFNILDYGEVAGKIEAMAKEVNALVGSVDSSVPQLQRLSQQAAVNMQQVVDRAFRLGLILVSLLLVGILLVCLIYRLTIWRLSGKNGGNRNPKAEKEV